MKKVVHMYLARATAKTDNRQGYAAGEKHTMLIFLADYVNDYQWQQAEQVALDAGWRDIEFGKAGRVTTEQIALQDATLQACYQQALQQGSALLVYAPVEAHGGGANRRS